MSPIDQLKANSTHNDNASQQISEITLLRPDDWHLHVRDNEALKSVVPYTARQCGRAIIMPNLNPPVTTTEKAKVYLKKIQAAAQQ